MGYSPWGRKESDTTEITQYTAQTAYSLNDHFFKPPTKFRLVFNCSTPVDSSLLFRLCLKTVSDH